MDTLVIGRGAGPGGLTLPDPRASRRHATLRRLDGDRLELEDTSSNGTEVNGARVDRAEVHLGDVLRLGDSFLVIVRPGAADHPIAPIVGNASSTCELRADIALIAPEEVTVLIRGETGTGKELVARALHQCSGRDGEFVPVNCAAIPAELAESQLFGHVAGAFTGARNNQPGFFRSAEGGTLFLDEIGDLPAALQAKLLRVLEDMVVIPVGATRGNRCDARVIAATHRALGDGDEFRDDLYARLAEVTLAVSPLRERREDILAILDTALGPTHAPYESDLVEALLLHSWPHNVRELIKLASELRIRGKGHDILTLELVAKRLPTPSVPTTQAIEAIDRDAFVAICEKHDGNVAKIAVALGRSRKQIYRYVAKWGVDLAALREQSGGNRA